MNEERIKERCKREDIALKIIKGFLEKDCYTDTELEYSLNTLLDLYNKQQRVMKSQEKIIMEQEKEIDNYKKQEFGNLFNGRYISKDKIRDKIKELNKDIENFCNEGCDTRHFKYIKNFLEELLKE